VQRLGWSSRAAIRASSRNIATKRGSVAMFGWMIFSATHLLKPDVASKRARYTEAMPPCAMR
jgi:hypothetical protein